MPKNKKLKYLIIIFFLIFIGLISYIGSTIGTQKLEGVKKLIPNPIKKVLNNTIFIIPNLKKEIEINRKRMNSINERIQKYENLQSINGFQIENLIIESENAKNKYQLKKYVFNSNFISGESSLLNKNIPRHPVGYLDKNNSDFFLVSGKGTINYFKKDEILKDRLKLYEIKNNLNSFFIDDADFFTNAQIGVRDILIKDNFIYLSYNNLKKENCYNIEILKADLNYSFLKFENFYTYPECIEVSKIQKFFVNQSGGRIVDFNDNKILFSTGSMRAYYKDETKKIIHEQDVNSKFGKVISINLETLEDKIFTLGHRNPQGLLYDKENNIVLETEHGPQGGDEINILEQSLNYGWPISSYGVHYDGKFRENAPLNKSHIDFGFQEPLKYWTPGIGISQLVKSIDDENEYYVSSMKNKSIHKLKINFKNKSITNYDILEIGQRIRDIVVDTENNIYILFLENPGRIATLKKL